MTHRNEHKQCTRKIARLALAVLVLIAFSHIISAAYLGIGDNHAWRQSDVYGHILGFMHTRGFVEYDRFMLSMREVYDIPIYQYI